MTTNATLESLLVCCREMSQWHAGDALAAEAELLIEDYSPEEIQEMVQESRECSLLWQGWADLLQDLVGQDALSAHKQ